MSLQVNETKCKSVSPKKSEKSDIPAAIVVEHEYQESNSGSYSTTTTLSMNKTDLLPSKMLSIPSTIR